MDNGTTNFLLGMILLIVNGVPVLPLLQRALLIGALLVVLLGLALIWPTFMALAFLAWAIWQFDFMKAVAGVFACIFVVGAVPFGLLWLATLMVPSLSTLVMQWPGDIVFYPPVVLVEFLIVFWLFLRIKARITRLWSPARQRGKFMTDAEVAAMLTAPTSHSTSPARQGP